MYIRWIVLLTSAWLGSTLHAGEPLTIKSVAEVHGLKDFYRVQRLAYTFNVKTPGFAVSRSWIWEPHTGQVTCETKNKAGAVEKTTYNRKAGEHLEDAQLKKVDHWFINDQFWLLFPFHVVWDESVTVLEKGEQALPIGPGKGFAMEVQYPKTGGYTPGDVYEIFVNGEGLIQEWIFRKGGQEKPSMITRWFDYQGFGPLSIALDHKSADESFRLWFTGVKVDMGEAPAEP